MKIGIIPNIYKKNISEVISILIKKLRENELEYFLCDTALQVFGEMSNLGNIDLVSLDDIFSKSDIVISIGGDGTMLHTAYLARECNTPILGVNYGKLGFLAEVDINRIDNVLDELKNGKYIIEERIVLEGDCLGCADTKLFAINDVVIDKGSWPKMIEISIKVDDDYVTTFAADGLILATPTGSTGYSLSTGGPVVNPLADVITLSPISPHSLTMRHLVLASHQTIKITVNSQHTSINVNCDGQRVSSSTPPLELIVSKSEKTVRLVHTNSTNYFQILREKLFWGMDVRKNSSNV